MRDTQGLDWNRAEFFPPLSMLKNLIKEYLCSTHWFPHH